MQFELRCEDDSLVLFSKGQKVDVVNPTEYVNTTLIKKHYKSKELNHLREWATFLVQQYTAAELVKHIDITNSEPLALLTFARYCEVKQIMFKMGL